MYNENEIKQMIEGFDFYTFLHPPKDLKYPLGGWIIITDNQCAIGYNDYNGQGYHGDSLRKAFCKILETERMSPLVTPSVTQANYIIGIMMSGAEMGYILFRIDDLKEITPNQLKLLEKLKEEYNEIVYKRSQELNQSLVLFEVEGVEIPSYNFDTLYHYLSHRINEEKILPDDINVIGQITLGKVKKIGER